MWPNPQFPADLVTFTEEILNGKLLFLCSERIIPTSNRWKHKNIEFMKNYYKQDREF